MTRSTAFQEESPEKHSTYQKPHKTQRHSHTCGGWGCHPGQADHFRQPAWARAAGQKERCHSGGNAFSVTGPAGAAPAWHSEAPCLGGPATVPVAGGARVERGEGRSMAGTADSQLIQDRGFVPSRVFREGVKRSCNEKKAGVLSETPPPAF